MIRQVNINWQPIDSILRKRYLNKGGMAQQTLDSEIYKKSEPYTPKLTGAMIESGASATNFGSGVVQWKTAYAKRQYYTNPGGKGLRGSYWFQRMWNSNGQQIVNDVAKVIGGKSV